MIDIPVHPVQRKRDLYFNRNNRPVAPQVVTLRAYEVYCHIYHPQVALITGECRGGFSVSELIALLYAHSFPKEEWENRVDEAFKGMNL
jgi:hypothetical protein